MRITTYELSLTRVESVAVRTMLTLCIDHLAPDQRPVNLTGLLARMERGERQIQRKQEAHRREDKRFKRRPR